MIRFSTRLIILCILIILNSCKQAEKEEDTSVERIKVEVQKKYPEGNFEDYFSESKLVALESTESSFFSEIARLSLYDNKIYILDRAMNYLLIFSMTGKFLNKIAAIGKGPGEYISLWDFAIDEDRQHLILYTDIPYRLFTFTLDGKSLLKEETRDGSCFDIGYQDNQILSYEMGKGGQPAGMDKIFGLYNMETKEKQYFMDMDEEDKAYRTQLLVYPAQHIIKSENLSVSLKYTETIYALEQGKVVPQYYIDFGADKTPDNMDPSRDDIFYYVTDNNYGFAISHFRENKKYATFNFWANMITIYDKVLKKAKSYSIFINKKGDQMPFYKYFAHDGADNKIISIYPAYEFKSQMKIYKKDPKIWKELPEYLKKMYNEVSDNGNPLLIIYTFKE